MSKDTTGAVSVLTDLEMGGPGYNLVMPYFVVEGKGVRKPVVSMPGIAQLSVDLFVKEAAKAKALGVPAVIVFGIPKKKDSQARGAYASDGIVQRAVAAVKKHVKGLCVITDVCLCEYTDHGHCGVMKKSAAGEDWAIDLEHTLELLAATAVSHAKAGADMVAPSAMMKGQVRAIRAALHKNGFSRTPVMGYSAKFASAFYGPFRDAAESAPKFGDRTSYQLDPADDRKALARVAADIAQGADIVMVKPGLAYLDVLRQAKDKFTTPLAVYNVSGEYAMVKAAAANGWIDEKKVVLEEFTAMKRAGAKIIISYHACDVMRWRQDSLALERKKK